MHAAIEASDLEKVFPRRRRPEAGERRSRFGRAPEEPVAWLVPLMRDADTLVDVSNFAVGLLTGRDVPVTVLPAWILPVTLALPLTYGFDVLRAVLLGTRSLLPLWIELAILVAFMVAMVWLGARAFAAVERRVRVRGSLGRH